MKKKLTRCPDCGTMYKSYSSEHCCKRHASSCAECSVKDHIADTEHALAFRAKEKSTGPAVLVKVK